MGLKIWGFVLLVCVNVCIQRNYWDGIPREMAEWHMALQIIF